MNEHFTFYLNWFIKNLHFLQISELLANKFTNNLFYVILKRKIDDFKNFNMN